VAGTGAPHPATLQARLEEPGDDVPAAGPPGVEDPVGLLRHLEARGRFHRDSRFGRIFHPGKLAFRENQATDSLHIVVHGNRLAAHVDRVSPLGLRAEGPTRYSLRRAAAHNLAGMAEDLVRLARGRQGDHRSELDCEWIWDSAPVGAGRVGLLDPKASGWSVQMEARVDGALDEGRLRAALVQVLGPAAGDDPLRVVDCPDPGSLDAARHHVLSAGGDPTAAPVHAGLARSPDGDVLLLNVNHAVADGFGALTVLRSVATAYAADTVPGPRLDLVATLDLPVRPASPSDSTLVGNWLNLVELVRNRLARPARLAPDQPDHRPGYGFHMECLSVDDTRRLFDPGRPGTSRNVLAAALHLAIGDWNLAHGSPGRRIGVLVPVNLRPPGWRDGTVGNFSVTARLSTSRRHRSGPAAALRAVTAQTTRNKRTRTGIALVAALERSGLLALWAKQSLVVLQPLIRNRLLDTAMLANLGSVEPPISFGGDVGVPLDVWFSVPARTPLSLCVGAVTVSGRLHLVFRYPHRLFSPDAARRFAATLLASIREASSSR